MRKMLISVLLAALAISLATTGHAAPKDEAFKYLLDGYKAVGREDYDAAFELFDKAIEIDPTNAKAYEGKASIYNFRQDIEGAADSFGKACEYDPENLDYAYQYAILLGALSRHEESLAALDRALTVEPDNRILMGYKGAVLNILHRFGEAEAVYDKGVELYPEDGGMYSGMGYAQIGLEKYDVAVTNLQNALALLGKRDRNTWVALAMALKKRGGEEDIKKSQGILVGVIKGGGGIDEHAVCALGLLDKKEDMYKALEALLKERPTARSILRNNLKLRDYWDDEKFKELMQG
jgi:tetratricopeptide (TPR) repeat protein